MLLALALLCSAPAALAKEGTSGGGGGEDDGRHESRASGICSKGAASRLRLRSRDGEIRVTFDLNRRRSGERWRVVLVHERRVAWRGTLRTRVSTSTLHVRRTVADYDGPDLVTARASGPRGLTCTATATLPA